MSSAPLTIAMIGKGWFPQEVGGLDRYFTSLYREYATRGDLAPKALVIGLTDHPNVTGVGAHEDPLWRRLLAVARAARRIDADVVDAHFALYALPALLASRRLRRLPLVVHFQGPWADEDDQSRWKPAVKRLIERAVYRRAERFVVLTEAFKRVLVERYGVAPWRVDVEPPGIDLVRFCPGDRAESRRVFGLPPDAFVACTARRLVGRMGIEILLDAWTKTLERVGSDAVLLVVGDGPRRQRLEQRVIEAEISDNVRFLGRVDDADLMHVYRAADVNVVPSIANEGFGLVVLEAAACGTASVVTDVGGLPEAVRELDTSLVTPSRSTDALADRLIAAAGGARPTVAQARSFAEQHAWPHVAERNVGRLRTAAAGRDRARFRVCYVDHVARLSGGEIALLRLLPHLENVDPHVILGEDGPLVGELRAAGISVEVLRMPRQAQSLRRDRIRLGGISPLALLGAASYTLRLARRFRALEPDLVHTNSLKAGIYGSIAAKLARVPVLWHVRDRIALDYMPASAVRLVRLLVRRIPDTVVANSRATLETLDQSPASAVVYSIVPEVMPLTRSKPALREQRRTTFAIVGRLAKWKGQDIFVDAFARAFPSGQQRALIIGEAMFGDDEAEFRNSLVSRVRALGIEHRVEFRGFSSDVWSDLQEIDVLVHASRSAEPFGQVVLEGMAAGVAVVATDAGGPRELITDGRNGLLYAPSDVDGLARLLRELDSDPDRRWALGAAAQARARDFLPGPIAAQMEGLYGETVSRRA